MLGQEAFQIAVAIAKQKRKFRSPCGVGLLTLLAAKKAVIQFVWPMPLFTISTSASLVEGLIEGSDGSQC